MCFSKYTYQRPKEENVYFKKHISLIAPTRASRRMANPVYYHFDSIFRYINANSVEYGESSGEIDYVQAKWHCAQCLRRPDKSKKISQTTNLFCSDCYAANHRRKRSAIERKDEEKKKRFLCYMCGEKRQDTIYSSLSRLGRTGTCDRCYWDDREQLTLKVGYDPDQHVLCACSENYKKNEGYKCTRCTQSDPVFYKFQVVTL